MFSSGIFGLDDEEFVVLTSIDPMVMSALVPGLLSPSSISPLTGLWRSTLPSAGNAASRCCCCFRFFHLDCFPLTLPAEEGVRGGSAAGGSTAAASEGASCFSDVPEKRFNKSGTSHSGGTCTTPRATASAGRHTTDVITAAVPQ